MMIIQTTGNPVGHTIIPSLIIDIYSTCAG